MWGGTAGDGPFCEPAEDKVAWAAWSPVTPAGPPETPEWPLWEPLWEERTGSLLRARPRPRGPVTAGDVSPLRYLPTVLPQERKWLYLKSKLEQCN